MWCSCKKGKYNTRLHQQKTTFQIMLILYRIFLWSESISSNLFNFRHHTLRTPDIPEQIQKRSKRMIMEQKINHMMSSWRTWEFSDLKGEDWKEKDGSYFKHLEECPTEEISKDTERQAILPSQSMGDSNWRLGGKCSKSWESFTLIWSWSWWNGVSPKDTAMNLW